MASLFESYFIIELPKFSLTSHLASFLDMLLFLAKNFQRVNAKKNDVTENKLFQTEKTYFFGLQPSKIIYFPI
jgi:hypothetical protein